MTKTLKDLNHAITGDTLWDKDSRSSIKGLHLRVFEHYSAWYLYYRTNCGIQRKPKIGDYPLLGVTDAREIAQKLLLEVATGEDLAREAKQKQEEELERKRREEEAELERKRQSIPTLDELFQQVALHHFSTTQYQNSGWAKEATRLYNREIKSFFGHYKIDAITRSDVKTWHACYEGKEVTGNMALAVLSVIFNFAISEGLFKGVSPCFKVKKHEEIERDRVASPEELRKLYEILIREKDASPKEVSFLMMLLFTGARPRALERARWDQIECRSIDGQDFGLLKFNRKTVRGKTKSETLNIPPQGMELLKALPRDSELIFNVKLPRSLWDRVRKEAGCPDLWARDFRRTFGSVGLSGGEGLGVISNLMNHQDIQTTHKIYAKTMESARLQAVLNIAKSMETIFHG